MRDLLDTLVLLGVLQGAGLSLVVGLRRDDALANRLLAALVGAVAALQLCHYCEARWAFSGYPHLLGLGRPLPFTFGPLLYLYIVALTRPVSQPDPRWLVHALPAAFFLAYMTATFYGLDGAEKLAFVGEIRGGRAPLSVRLIDSFRAVQAVSYLVASWIELRRYGRRMQGYFSDLSRVNLRWLRAMVIASAATWSIAIAATLLRVAGMEVAFASVLSRGVEVGSTLVIFLTGYLSLWQPGLFQKADAAARIEPEVEPPPAPQVAPESVAPGIEARPRPPAPVPLASVGSPAAVPARPKYQRNRIDDAEAQELVDRLLRLMREQRPYRDGALTLPTLADALAITPHALSQILNVRLEKSFYAFVNSYRVAEVKEALADPAQSARGVLEIALDAGFNSKSTLNSFFKRETGLTPTEYRNKAQKSPRQSAAA